MNSANAFGLNALMGVIKIKVRPEDLNRARQALSEYHNQHGESWYCGSCQEMNEASFDICWKCGGERADVAAELPRPAETPPAEIRPEDLLTQHQIVKDYDARPYAPPAADLTPPDPTETMDPEQSAAQAEYEDTVERAYRASVIGMITVPWLFHVYSMVLLLGALGLPAKSTPKLNFRFRVAMAINLAAFALAIYLFCFRAAY